MPDPQSKPVDVNVPLPVTAPTPVAVLVAAPAAGAAPAAAAVPAAYDQQQAESDRLEAEAKLLADARLAEAKLANDLKLADAKLEADKKLAEETADAEKKIAIAAAKADFHKTITLPIVLALLVALTAAVPASITAWRIGVVETQFKHGFDAVETHVGQVRRISVSTHELVNSGSLASLRAHLVTARQLAKLSGEPEDIGNMEELEQLVVEHIAKQKKADEQAANEQQDKQAKEGLEATRSGT